jgi:hypothetical protein
MKVGPREMGCVDERSVPMTLTLGYVSANSIAQMLLSVPMSSTFCGAFEIGAKRAFHPGVCKYVMLKSKAI